MKIEKGQGSWKLIRQTKICRNQASHYKFIYTCVLMGFEVKLLSSDAPVQNNAGALLTLLSSFMSPLLVNRDDVVLARNLKNIDVRQLKFLEHMK